MADDRDESQPTERSRSFGRDSSGLRGARNMIQPDAVPKPPNRSGAAHNPLVVFGNAIFIILVLVAVGGYFGLRRFSAPGPLTAEKIVYVPKGSGIDGIADSLERQGVIDGATTFTTGIWILGHSNDLKAGEYSFKPAASMYEVMNVLVGGKVIQHTLTIPEGLTSEAILDRLDQDDILAGDPPPVPKEGSLLPDTYKYERGTTRAQMVSRMQAEQKALIDQVWKKRAPNLPLKSPLELVTLASIVEKETGQADERSHVASVFVNRLQKNMRLQSDPTVIYGIVGGKGKLERPLQSADLSQPTPFNTYTIAGLPPSPIANPGRAAMEAVANPLQTKDLYFVADGTGGHAFAETLEQHNRNVARWRQVQQQQGQAQPLGDDTAGTQAPPAQTAAPAVVAPAVVAPAPAAPSPAATTPAPANTAPSAPAATTNCKPAKSKKCRNAKQTAVPPATPAAPAPEVAPAPAAPAPAVPTPAAPAPAVAAPATNAAGPATAPVVSGAPGSTPAVPVDPAHPGATGKKGGFDDPVANTKHDPLLDNTFDLNSPQSVQ
jgi:UPF0755 protein